MKNQVRGFCNCAGCSLKESEKKNNAWYCSLNAAMVYGIRNNPNVLPFLYEILS